jgi:SNF2 family DNA or RNA helicase
MQDLSASHSSNHDNRSSKRERTSTLTWIDGQAVLRQNNYVVRGGQYVMGNDGMDTPPHEILRIQHNDQVQRTSKSNGHWRWKFLANQIPLLRHFCEPLVLEQLEHMTQNCKKFDSYSPLKIETAPTVIEATLRDYQLQGLEFMVNMHNQNLSMILGDEMGLVRYICVCIFY